MFWNNKNSKKTNILLGILCIALLVVLGGIMVKSRQEQQQEAQRLSKLADQHEKGIEDYEGAKAHVAQIEAEAEEEEADSKDGSSSTQTSKEQTSKDQESDKTTDTEESDAKDAEADKNSSDTEAQKAEDAKEDKADTEDTEETVSEPTGIVCWGDDLINGEASATDSYMSVLQKLLTENGYSLTVVNKTLQGGGTLSMMKMAGVSDETLQGYITKHQQAAAGANLNVTETGIRDLTEEETTRNDLDCIPVIFMGYYGGWNHDVAELAEQQENILNTFPNKDKFIVVGTRPMDGTVSAEDLDRTLSEKWGEHYISLASVTAQPAATNAAQQAMAEAILSKLEELGYISKK